MLVHVNVEWKKIINQASVDISSLTVQEQQLRLVNLLEINNRVATSLGQSYFIQLNLIFNDLMNLYTAFSKIGREVLENGIKTITQNQNTTNMDANQMEMFAAKNLVVRAVLYVLCVVWLLFCLLSLLFLFLLFIIVILLFVTIV
jgi:hypothetical protein